MQGKIKSQRISRLNLGCGTLIKKGYINLDITKHYGVDIIHNIDVIPWPFSDNSFEEIIAKSILEHITDFPATIDEMVRISKNNAIWIIKMPFYNSLSLGRDPTHKRGCSKDTFDYWTKKTNHSYTNLKFILQIIKIKEHPTTIGKFIPKQIRNFVALIFGEIIESLTFIIKVKKCQSIQ